MAVVQLNSTPAKYCQKGLSFRFANIWRPSKSGWAI